MKSLKVINNSCHLSLQDFCKLVPCDKLCIQLCHLYDQQEPGMPHCIVSTFCTPGFTICANFNRLKYQNIRKIFSTDFRLTFLLQDYATNLLKLYLTFWIMVYGSVSVNHSNLWRNTYMKYISGRHSF